MTSRPGKEHFDVVVIGGGIAAASCVDQLCVVDNQRSVLLLSESRTLKGIRNVIHITDNLEDFDVYEQSLEEMESKHENLTVVQASVVRVDSKSRSLEARSIKRSNGKDITTKGRTMLAAITSSDGLSKHFSISYVDLCICSGARPNTIFPAHKNIIGIRDSDSVDVLRSKLRTAKRLALVGNGGIALELACELRKSGAEIIWITKDHFIGNTFLDASASEFLSQISSFITTPYDAQDEKKPKKRLENKKSFDNGSQCNFNKPNVQENNHNIKRPKLVKHAKLPCCPKHARVRKPKQRNVCSANEVGGDQIRRNNDAGSPDEQIQDVDTNEPRVTGHAVGPEWMRRLCEQSSASSPVKTQSRNINWKPGLLVTSVKTDDNVSQIIDNGRNEKWAVWLTLSNGETVGCDFLISATGVIPNAPFLGPEFVRNQQDGGVVVNRRLRTPGIPHVYCAGDVCSVDSTLPVESHDGKSIIPEPSPLWFQMRLWSQARTMGQLAALSLSGMHDVVDSSMFFELFTHVSRFFGFKVTLLGAFNGQNLPHSGEVQTQIVTQEGPRGPCKPSAVVPGRVSHTIPTSSGSIMPVNADVALGPGVKLHGGPGMILSSGDREEATKAGTTSTTTDMQILVRVTPGQEYIKLVMWRGRIAGALLIGDTDLEETFENLILSQFDCTDLGINLLDPEVDIEDYFD